jgi:ABC-type branched-subunit amino acid transport system substrate-binding protein
MITASKTCKILFDEADVKSTLIAVGQDQTDFKNILQNLKEEEYDSFVFFGYEEFGFAMKQARDLGISVPFFASTVLLNPAYYKNSEGAILGTECSFFTAADGNYVLVTEFLSDYQLRFGETPSSIWPPMQAFDAMNIILNQLGEISETKLDTENFDFWLRNKLLAMHYHQGVCGTISINPNGSSKGIYFSLYGYESEGKLIKIRR